MKQLVMEQFITGFLFQVLVGSEFTRAELTEWHLESSNLALFGRKLWQRVPVNSTPSQDFVNLIIGVPIIVSNDSP